MELTQRMVSNFQKHLKDDPRTRLAINAVTRVEIQELAINRELYESINFSFSHEVETAPEATAQLKVGICWMFAGFNLCRWAAQKQLHVKSFEFSPNYLMFWDKLEKANYFLEKVIEFRDQPPDERLLWMLLKDPCPDGGYWHTFVNLVHKYGLIPKAVMQNTKFTDESPKLNFVLAYKLRQHAAEVYHMHKAGKTLEQIEKKRKQWLDEFYRMLTISFGILPERFEWSYRDEDKQFHRFSKITPQEFYKQHVGLDLDDFCVLWNCPMENMPYYKTYTIAHTENMVGGGSLWGLNLPISELKRYAVTLLKDDHVCFFSCDIGQQSLRKEGILYKGIYDYAPIFQTNFDMDKGTQLEFGHSASTHSMVFTGVDLVRNKPVKWKVENSWGAEVGKKGYFIMSDEWFDGYVFEILVPKKYLTPDLLKAYEQPPIVLPRWHPFA